MASEEQIQDTLSKLDDIRIYIPYSLPDWLVPVLVVTAVIILLIVIIKSLLTYFKQKNLKALSNLEIARNSLKELDTGLHANAFYTQLTNILRDFLFMDLDIDVYSYTTKELYNALYPLKENSYVQQLTFQKTIDLFSRADFAKFADKNFASTTKLEDVDFVDKLLVSINSQKQLKESQI